LRPLRQQATQAIRPSANPFYFPSLTQSGVPRVASAAKPLRSGVPLIPYHATSRLAPLPRTS
jgi:hypothetical protein